tara:strand:+ start:251 stop:1012 length:762 start_codon:yes stop_codon:yes gene_type:complete
MSIKTKASKLAILVTNPEILFCKKKYLFVVSHMRSRSSVLSHILGNNPEVCGYKELHQSYKGQMSLINMQIELAKDLKCQFRNKYLLDKILNNFTISDDILNKVKPKILFLLREPEDTIKSIINMGFKTGVERYKDPIKVTEYYCKRMHTMEILSYKAGDGNLFIQSKDLVESSKDTLKKISIWLNLEEPLKTTYTTFKDTGVMGFGDPLENIKSGVLQATSGYFNINIPEHLLSKANDSYKKCKATLINNVK